MKATQTIFIIVMVALLNISATDRYTYHITIDQDQPQHGSQLQKLAPINVLPVKAVAPIDFGSHANADSHHHTDEEGKMHFFHLSRVRKARRHCNLLCILSKLVLVVTHLSLLIYLYLTFFMQH
jgi:hypothetical protein